MARLKPQFVRPEELSQDDIAAIVGIARRQVELMDALESALLADDVPRALDAARALVGLEREVRRT